MVTRRRSATGVESPAGGARHAPASGRTDAATVGTRDPIAAPPANAPPQAEQNLAPARVAAPQAGQVTPSAAPHSSQKRAAAPLAAPHPAQVTPGPHRSR